MYIRIANITDLPDIIDLKNRLAPVMSVYEELWKEKKCSTSNIKKDIETHNLFVLVLDDKIVGAVVIDAYLPPEYEFIPWKSSPNTYTFHRLMIDIEHQGKGLAQALLTFIVKRGVNMGMKSLRADTHKDNTIMRTLFDKYNFTFVDNISIGKEKSDFLCYEKTLF